MIKIICLSFLFATAGLAQTKILLKTNKGEIVLEMNEKKAPLTTKNFIKYVQDKYYDGLIFHRVIPSFMIQGGGHRPDMSMPDTRGSIKNEAQNGLSNLRGTIAMARTNDPHSASAQFFINVVDNLFLDYQNEEKWGYCVFGKVVKGLDVVDKIRQVKTSTRGQHRNVPVDSVVIEKAQVIN